jgi:hypothetical protein
MPNPPPRRSAKQRPLSGLLIHAGRREAVVVTALEKRLLINVEADISAIPIARVRRDEGLNLHRTDQRDWQIRFDTLPPAESWVHDLPLLSTFSPLRRAVMILLLLLGLAAAWLWNRDSKLPVMGELPDPGAIVKPVVPAIQLA